jgi:colanic acid biosynthesis glycosyl transferase WcaI
MKILIYGLNYAPELIGIGKYTGELGGWLAEHGHLVRAVTAPPYYPQWRVATGYSSSRYLRETINGVLIYRCPLWVPRHPKVVYRFVHLASFAINSLPVVLIQALLWRPEIILVVQPPFLSAPGAWLAARLSGARVWMHVQDHELDAAFEVGLLRGSWLRRSLAVVERAVLSRMDRISSISSEMLRLLTQKGVPPEKQVFFPNWVDTLQIKPMDRPSHFRKHLGLGDGDVVALYAGNMGRKQALEHLIEAARRLERSPHLRIVLSGDGPMRLALEKEGRGLSNVRFLPLQPAEEFNELLNLADLHLLMQRTDSTGPFMPSKLAGMLASGRPVVATVHPDSDVAHSIEGCGRIVPPGQPVALAQAILELAQEPEKRRLLGERARRVAVQTWEKENILRKFEQELADLHRSHRELSHAR